MRHSTGACFKTEFNKPENDVRLEILRNAFGFFVNNYGSIKDWGEEGYNVEIQVIDSNGNTVYQSE